MIQFTVSIAMREKIAKFLTAFFIALMTYSISLAGTIDPALSAKISGAGPGKMFSTIIQMAEQLDVVRMKKQHDERGFTLAERHREVIVELQKIAETSQREIIGLLDIGLADRTVHEYQSYWITNVITAEMTADGIIAFGQREDIKTIYPDFEIKPIEPIRGMQPSPPSISSVETGLRVIGADSMWSLGYTGAGIIVCNFDTGVDGSHPALNHSWRGANGYPSDQCWFDPLNPDSLFPYDSYGHGTHTMGTICGRSQITPDTIGIAIDAQWIASNTWGSSNNTFGAFQWAADPDGNPYTIDDMPAVISNSWGSGSCNQLFYNMIDNCEAAGTAVIFAAGNSGPGPQTVLSPANRIDTPHHCFGVGAIDGNNPNYPIAGFSSRGPSSCDGQTIKPDLVCPGVSIRSSVPGEAYEYWSGTSMATPHIAGALALLRQVNPNASVDTIKWALMQSAQDLGQPGPDNDYGWGLINIPAAMELLPPVESPNLITGQIIVVEPNNNHPDPGDTIEIYIEIKNLGLSAENVFAILSTDDAHVAVSQDSVFYGTITRGDSITPEESFIVYIEQETPNGWRIDLDLNIYANTNYNIICQVHLIIGTIAEFEISDHDLDFVSFTISNFGQYGLARTEINTIWNGQGFRMPNNVRNLLYEGALLIGNGPQRVSNGAHNEYELIGDDFLPLAQIERFEPGPFADQEFLTKFNDQGAEYPLGVQVTQRSFSFSSPPDRQYIIIEYTITNIGYEPLENLLIAHFDNWDITGDFSPEDMVNFDRDRNLGYQYHYPFYRGQQVLSELGTHSFIALQDAEQVDWPHFTLENKWDYMSAGFSDTAITSPSDCSMMITTGPYYISPGDSIVSAFAIHGAGLLEQLRSSADAANDRYSAMSSVNENMPLSREFDLLRNYPNPFNASTTIEFTLLEESMVELVVYDLLGRKVETLVDEEKLPGRHQVIWDASEYSSGVYFYRLQAGDLVETKRMVLLK